MEYSIPLLMIRKCSVSLSKCPQLEGESVEGFNLQQWSRLELNLNLHANGVTATRGAQPRVAARIGPGWLQRVSRYMEPLLRSPLLCAHCAAAVLWASRGTSQQSTAEGSPGRGTE